MMDSASAGICVYGGPFALTASESREALFEVVSAIATVGLSLGVTAELSAASHIILILLMYIGRVGDYDSGSIWKQENYIGLPVACRQK